MPSFPPSQVPCRQTRKQRCRSRAQRTPQLSRHTAGQRVYKKNVKEYQRLTLPGEQSSAIQVLSLLTYLFCRLYFGGGSFSDWGTGSTAERGWEFKCMQVGFRRTQRGDRASKVFPRVLHAMSVGLPSPGARSAARLASPRVHSPHGGRPAPPEGVHGDLPHGVPL